MSEIDVQKSDYLGDAVYAYHDGYGVWLFTHNGIGMLDKIFLEPEVFQALERFNERHKEQL